MWRWSGGREKNLTKMIQIRRQNVPKSTAGGGLDGSWAALGQVLAFPWLQGVPGLPPVRLLGSSWAALEPSWAPLGRLLGRLWHQVEASWKHLGDFLV